MNKNSKIYIAGHRGLVGSAIFKKLSEEGYNNIIYRDSKELDLREQSLVRDFFEKEKPNYVFLTAARAGGVHALNTYRADSIYDNLLIQSNVIHCSYKAEVKKLLYIGSNCVYPKLAAQPLKEEYILSGKLERTTQSYAIAKLAGIEMCQAYRYQYGCDFITALPVNLYGENDNYRPEVSHVMAALLSKFYKAKMNNEPSVEVWGTGNARREFMHADDVADACLFLMLNYNEDVPVNVGTGEDISIRELAHLIKEIVKYEGEIVFNTSKPDGVQSKLFDVSRINSFGWRHKIELAQGIDRVYKSLSK